MPPFWKIQPLEAMSDAQWDALCDRCGRCCLHKIQDLDGGEVLYTDLACHMFDPHSCLCRDYAHRRQVATCWQLTPALARHLRWLPLSCAYRRLAEGRPLADWHPLVSGSFETVHAAGISMRRRVRPARSPSNRQLMRRVRWDVAFEPVE